MVNVLEILYCSTSKRYRPNGSDLREPMSLKRGEYGSLGWRSLLPQITLTAIDNDFLRGRQEERLDSGISLHDLWFIWKHIVRSLKAPGERRKQIRAAVTHEISICMYVEDFIFVASPCAVQSRTCLKLQSPLADACMAFHYMLCAPRRPDSVPQST